MTPSRRRRIAHTIVNDRAYLAFEGTDPCWSDWTVVRGHIPRRWWMRPSWRARHIVEPTIRERARWTFEQLSVPGVLPRMNVTE